MVVLRDKARYQRGHSAQYSGFKLASSTFVLSKYLSPTLSQDPTRITLLPSFQINALYELESRHTTSAWVLLITKIEYRENGPMGV